MCETIAMAMETSGTSADYLAMRYVEECVTLGVTLAPWGSETLTQAQVDLVTESWCNGDTGQHLSDLANQVETDLATLDSGPYVTDWDGGYVIRRECANDTCEMRDTGN